MHEGIDIGVGFGTPIRAAAAGTVIHAGWLGGYGNLVVVDHGGGLSTAYGHQQAIYVSPGQHVDQGTVLGRGGLDRELDRAAPPFRGPRQRLSRRPAGVFVKWANPSAPTDPLPRCPRSSR